jgi:hypothetical protein
LSEFCNILARYLKIYGPFKAGEIAAIPRVNADGLVKHLVANPLEDLSLECLRVLEALAKSPLDRKELEKKL